MPSVCAPASSSGIDARALNGDAGNSRAPGDAIFALLLATAQTAGERAGEAAARPGAGDAGGGDAAADAAPAADAAALADPAVLPDPTLAIMAMAALPPAPASLRTSLDPALPGAASAVEPGDGLVPARRGRPVPTERRSGGTAHAARAPAAADGRSDAKGGVDDGGTHARLHAPTPFANVATRVPARATDPNAAQAAFAGHSSPARTTRSEARQEAEGPAPLPLRARDARLPVVAPEPAATDAPAPVAFAALRGSRALRSDRDGEVASARTDTDGQARPHAAVDGGGNELPRPARTSAAAADAASASAFAFASASASPAAADEAGAPAAASASDAPHPADASPQRPVRAASATPGGEAAAAKPATAATITDGTPAATPPPGTPGPAPAPVPARAATPPTSPDAPASAAAPAAGDATAASIVPPVAGNVAAMARGTPVEVATTVAAPGWTAEVAGKLGQAIGLRHERVDLRLNPEHLGPVDVRIIFAGETPSIVITAADPQTRHAFEQSLPQLHDLLAAQGIALGEASVQGDPRGPPPPPLPARAPGPPPRAATAALAAEAAAQRRPPAVDRLVDVFV